MEIEYRELRLANQAGSSTGSAAVAQPQDSQRTAPNSTYTALASTPGPPLSTSPEFPADSTFQAAARAEDLGIDRRRRPLPATPDQYLHALPAAVLLNRLPVPMLAIGLDGEVVYHNPAFATMLGHGPDFALTGYGLPALLDGSSEMTPLESVAALRNANNLIVEWHHAEGFPVRSVISESLFLRANDEILLFGIVDLTELMWMYPPESL